MRARLSHIPLLPIFVGLVAGVAITYWTESIWITVGVLTASIVGLGVRRMDLSLGGAGYILGWLALSISNPIIIDSLPEKYTPITGTVSSVKMTNGGLQIIMTADKIGEDESAVGGMRISVTTEDFPGHPLPGSIITIRGNYDTGGMKKDFRWPGMPVDYLRRNYISFHAFVRPDSIEIIACKPMGIAGKVERFFYELREEVSETILSSGLSDDASNFINALLTGDDDGISGERREAFSASGVAHVLALSGAHVAVLAVLIAIILFPLNWIGLRKWRYIITIVILWGFAIMTGMSASVVRSVIMASMLLTGYVIERSSSPLNSLCLAGILILIFDPMAVFAPGFQLSFIATAAILACMGEWRENKLLNSGKMRNIKLMILTTVVATVATAPLVAYHFHQLPLLFLLGNMIIVPVLPIAIGGGILVLILSLLNIPDGIVTWPLNRVIELLNAIIDYIAGKKWGVVDDIYFAGWWLLPLYVAIWGLYLSLRRKNLKMLAWVTGGGICIVIAMWVFKPSYSKEEVTIERRASVTSMVMRRGKRVEVYNNHDDMMVRYDSVEYARRLNHYLASRGVEEIKITNHAQDAGDESGVITIAGKRYAIAGGDAWNKQFATTDYLLVIKQFRGDIISLYSRVKADTILLSPDISKRRRERYFNELTEEGIPVIDCAATLFHREI